MVCNCTKPCGLKICCTDCSKQRTCEHICKDVTALAKDPGLTSTPPHSDKISLK